MSRRETLWRTCLLASLSGQNEVTQRSCLGCLPCRSSQAICLGSCCGGLQSARSTGPCPRESCSHGHQLCLGFLLPWLPEISAGCLSQTLRMPLLVCVTITCAYSLLMHHLSVSQLLVHTALDCLRGLNWTNVPVFTWMCHNSLWTHTAQLQFTWMTVC